MILATNLNHEFNKFTNYTNLDLPKIRVIRKFDKFVV
jgi:hypothetical protein